MLDWFKRGSGPSSNAGIFELYGQLAEEAAGHRLTGGRRVRLRAPPGVSHVGPLSGGCRAIAADGTVELTEDDAEPLLRAGWVRADDRPSHR